MKSIISSWNGTELRKSLELNLIVKGSLSAFAVLILLMPSAPSFASDTQDDRRDDGQASWCVSPVLPGPCRSFPASRRKNTLKEVIFAPASPGDHVYIHPGTYRDRPIVTIPGLYIKGVEGPNVTIFDGEGSSEAALTVRAGDVVLDGFTFTHSKPATDASGVGGGVDAAPPGNRNDPAQGRCENLDRELPDQICGNSNIPVTENFVPAYLGGTAVTRCVPINYPRDFTDKWGVNPTCPHALPGGFTLKNSRAINNWSNVTCDGPEARCYGVKVIARDLVTITDVEASNNGSDGDCTGHGYPLTKNRGPDGESCFGIMAHSAGQKGGVIMKKIKANDNRAKGNCLSHETCIGVFADEALRDVELKWIEAKNNGADGNCSGDDTCLGIGADGIEGKLTMTGLVAKDNGAKGSCGPNVNDSCTGIMIDGEDWGLGLYMKEIVANHNGAFGGDCSGSDSCLGINIDGRGGDLLLKEVQANDNGATGDCNATDSCGGIHEDAADVTGKFLLHDVQANRNGAGGRCIGNDSCAGIIHDTSFCTGDVDFKKVEASDNGSVGDCLSSDGCQGIVVDSGDVTGSFDLAGIKTNRNGSKQGNCTGADSCLGLLIDGGGIGLDPTAPPEDFARFCSVLTSPAKEFTAKLAGIESNSNGAGGNCTGGDSCDGVYVDGVLGSLAMKGVTANDNKAGRSIPGSTCSGSNSCSGVIGEVSPPKPGFVWLSYVEASRNGVGTGGTCVTPATSSNCAGVIARADELNTKQVDAYLSWVKTDNNSGDGTVVSVPGEIFIKNSSSVGNGGNGLVTYKVPFDRR